MGTLYVDRQGVRLAWVSGALEMRCDEKLVRTVPGRLLERVVMRADTQLSSATLASLADAGVGVVAFGGRSGQRVAHVLGAPHGDASVRLAQCQLQCDPIFAGAWSARIVRAKIAGQARVLERGLKERQDLRKPLHDASRRLREALARLERIEDVEVSSIRGIEGAAAAAYFAGFQCLFADSLGFLARRRRPPPDPVNSCLSLGYALLHSCSVRACWQVGLDPMVGFLHTPLHGRASMACDLMEPWRPHVDSWVWSQFRDRRLRDEHFGRDGSGACLLGKAGRAHFFAGFSDLDRRLSASLRRHGRAAARALAERVPLREMEAAPQDESDW